MSKDGKVYSLAMHAGSANCSRMPEESLVFRILSEKYLQLK